MGNPAAGSAKGSGISTEAVLIRDGWDRTRTSDPGLLDGGLWHLVLECIHPDVHWRALIQGAALARNGMGLALAGPSGSGKTTLAPGLVSPGFDYLSDDAVPLSEPDGEIVPWPLRLSIKPGRKLGNAPGRALSRRDPVGYEVCMIHRLIAVAAWTLLAFIAYATISPIQARPTLFTSPGFERLAAFAVLGALFCLAYPRHIALVCLIILGSGVLLELAQLLTPDRHGRIQDAITKMTGGALGIVAGRAILYFRQASRWFQN
jgi:hypothetical protein